MAAVAGSAGSRGPGGMSGWTFGFPTETLTSAARTRRAVSDSFRNRNSPGVTVTAVAEGATSVTPDARTTRRRCEPPSTSTARSRLTVADTALRVTDSRAVVCGVRATSAVPTVRLRDGGWLPAAGAAIATATAVTRAVR